MAEEYDVQGGQNPNIKALEVNIAIGGSAISVVGMFRNPGAKPAHGGGPFLFLHVVAGPASKILVMGIPTPRD